jgi:hypothetical protein
MELSIEMDPADHDISRKAFIKIRAARPSSYKNPSKIIRLLVRLLEIRSVQYRYGTLMEWEKLGELLLVPMAQETL